MTMIDQPVIAKPDFAYAPLMSTFDGQTAEVIVIRSMELGYHKTDARETRERIQEMNDAIGVDPSVAAAFSLCSMFGWGSYAEAVQAFCSLVPTAAERTVEA
jgi:uncharacterized iron-regulated protein